MIPFVRLSSAKIRVYNGTRRPVQVEPARSHRSGSLQIGFIVYIHPLRVSEPSKLRRSSKLIAECRSKFLAKVGSLQQQCVRVIQSGTRNCLRTRRSS